MDLGMFAKKIQVSEILFKYNVSIKEAIIIGAVIEELEQQCKKQKEIIDKAIEFTNKNWGTWCTHHSEYMTELQDILKGSDSNEKISETTR